MAYIRTKGQSILLELKAIIEDTGLFNEVAFDKIKDISQVNKFDACYIVESDETMEYNGRSTIKIEGYDRRMIVNLFLSLDMQDALDYKGIQEKVERAVLDDDKLWTVTSLQDRNILSAFWDMNEHFTEERKLKQGTLQFEFIYRACSTEN